MKITFKKTYLLVLLALACKSKSATTETNNSGITKLMSVQMADSEMKRNPEGWMIDFRKEPKWEYTNGLFATALQNVWMKTEDQKYFDYIKTFVDLMISEDGTIKTYKKTDYNIDRINSGKFLFFLYKETGDEKYRKAIDTLRNQMRTHPRTAEGGFWHKKIYPHQMWLDGLYMGSPFLAQYAQTFNEPTLFDDIANQIHLIDKYTWDENKKLFYHGWDESRQQKWSNPETGRSPHFWGRAMGWFSMALVDVLDFFPADHPQRKNILQITGKMAESIAMYQDPKSGVWWQILDLGGKEGNYLEASASSMFTYFLLKAVKRGYIDQKYRETAVKGYEGVLKNFIREDTDGGVSLTHVCSVAGLGGNPYRDGSYEYYINEPQRDNDPKGVGPFILASLLYEEMNKLAVSK